MLRIYGYAQSINVRKVLWTCSELGLSFDLQEWGGRHRSTSDPAFLALNPAGLVPVIDDDGVVVRESNAIVRYLADSRGRADLLPHEARRRAHIEMWMDWQASEFNNSWRYAFQGLVRMNAEFSDAVAIEDSVAQFSRSVGIVDEQLAKSGGFVCGPEFTIADVPIGLSIHRWRSLPAQKPEFAHVENYYEQLCQRSGFREYGLNGGP